MQELDIWKELGIEKTKDEKVIKAAYFARLKGVNPEDDPEGFKKLRTAFDEATAYARATDDEDEKDEYDLWIDEIREVYDNLSRRMNPKEWEKIFGHEICRSLDTQNMAGERLLFFMMDHYYMPYYVFNQIEEIFGIEERKNELSEKFPSNYIDFIVREMGNESDDGFYDYFDGNLEGNPDLLIQIQSQCFDDFYTQLLFKNPDERDFTSVHERLEEIYEMDIRHIYTPVIEEIVAFYENDFDTVKECFDKLVEKLGDDEQMYTNEHHLLEGYALGYEVTGQKEKADKVREQLSKNTTILHILSDCVRYYIDAGDNRKAKDLAIDYMEKGGDFPGLLSYMQKANEAMMKQYRIEADEGNEDSAFELGWIYFQNEQFKECIEYVQPKKPEEGSKNEYTYYNLLGRCLARNNQYDDAIPYLMRAHELILVVKEKGADGIDEERMIKREGLILATIANCYHEKARDLLENNKASRDNYCKSDEYMCEALKMYKASVEVEQDMKHRIFFQREMALINFETESYSRCIDICDEILKDVPDWYYIYLLRGKAFLNLDYPQNVIEDYHMIKRVVPDNLDMPGIYIAPLMAYIEYNRFEDATDIFEFANEQGAHSIAIDLLKMYFECKQNPDSHELTEITECIDRLINEENDLSKMDIADLIIYVAYVAKDDDDFVKIMQKAIECYPGCTKKANWHMGVYFEGKCDYQSAVKYFNNVVSLAITQETRDHNLLRVGKNHWYMDQDDEALEIYMSIYKRNPKQININRCLAEFYLFKFRADRKDETIDNALKYINDQFEIYVDQDVQRLRAEINLEKYDYKESKKDLLDILDNDPDSLTAMRMLERVYRYEGNFENAYNICLRLIEREGDDHYSYKYEKYICSSMALRKYDGLDKIILDGYKHDREWAFEKLTRLYICKERFDELMEAAKSAIKNGESTYEKFLGYRTVLDILSDTGVPEDDDKMKTAVKEYLYFIRNNPDRTLYGYDCLSVFYFEDYGDLKEAIKYQEMLQKEKMSDYYMIRSNLILAGLNALSGNQSEAKKYFEAFTKHVNNQFGSLKDWLKENGYSRTKYYDLGLYYYGIQDIVELQNCLDEMADRVVCKSCDKCKCFEYYIIKGHLEKLKGNIDEALKAYEIALDSGENANKTYITRMMKGL